MSGMAAGWLVVLVAAASVLRGVAGAPQGAAPAGRLAEAMVYASYSKDAYACRGDVHPANPMAEATKWTLKAIATAREIPPSDAEGDRRVGAFLSRQNATLESLLKWEKFLKDGDKPVAALLDRGSLQRAEALVADGSGPVCDPRLERLRALVRARREKFRALVGEGDGLSGSSPRQALGKYREAQRLDREDGGLQDKIRQLSRRR